MSRTPSLTDEISLVPLQPAIPNSIRNKGVISLQLISLSFLFKNRTFQTSGRLRQQSPPAIVGTDHFFVVVDLRSRGKYSGRDNAQETGINTHCIENNSQ